MEREILIPLFPTDPLSLLLFAERENKELKVEIGKLKSYIEELEYAKKTEPIIIGKASKNKIKKEEMYLRLKKQIHGLEERIKHLKRDRDGLIFKLSQKE